MAGLNTSAPLLVSLGLGLLITVTGVLVYTGRGEQIGPDRLGGRPAAMIAGGLVLIVLCAAVVARDAGATALVPFLLAIAIVLALFAGITAISGAPTWATPSWQKVDEEAEK